MMRSDEEGAEGRGNDPASGGSEGETKSGGLGADGTIPAHPDGVAAGFTGTPSHFEPEEDEAAD